jgi:hypothetical protein
MTKHAAYILCFALAAILIGGKISFLLWVGAFFSFLGGLVDLYAEVEKKIEGESDEAAHQQESAMLSNSTEALPAYIRTAIEVTADGGEDAVTNIGSVEKGTRDAGAPVELEMN